MIEQRTACRLKNGENMEILRIVPPEKELFAELAQLFGHKPETIVKTLLDRLQGRYIGESADFFFLGMSGGRCVGHIWYGYGLKQPRPLANFGEVYTVPEFRGCGVCDALLAEFERHFREVAPASAAFCTCGEEHVKNLYARHGFRTVVPGAKFGPLIFAKDDRLRDFDAFAADYYGAGEPLRLESGSIAFRHETECLLKFFLNKHDIGHGFAFAGAVGTGYFSGFYQLLHMQQEKRGIVAHALTADRRCVGWGFVMEPFGVADSFPVLDFQLHPAYGKFAAPWLAELLQRAARHGFADPVFFASDRFPEKIAAVEAAGMRKVWWRKGMNKTVITIYQPKEEDNK